MRGLVLERFGPPENLMIEDRPVPTPGPGQVLIKVEMAGLIYADSEARRGSYSFVNIVLPWRPGREAAGTIAALGPGVDQFQVGQRVVALVMSGGCQAEYVLASTSLGPDALTPAQIFAIPDEATWGQALVHVTNFRMAHFALHAWSSAKPGSWILVHGGCGGMGSLLLQLARELNCQVIASCRDEREAEYCRQNGADHCVQMESYSEDVMSLTRGQGVKVVFNGIGGHTVNKDPWITQRFGEIHYYGYTAGKEPLQPFVIERCLNIKTFAPDNFFHGESHVGANLAMFRRLSSGIATDVGHLFPLEEAASAHRLLDEGRVFGKVALKI